VTAQAAAHVNNIFAVLRISGGSSERCETQISQHQYRQGETDHLLILAPDRSNNHKRRSHVGAQSNQQ
jgi:hypothetical protein